MFDLLYFVCKIAVLSVPPIGDAMRFDPRSLFLFPEPRPFTFRSDLFAERFLISKGVDSGLYNSERFVEGRTAHDSLLDPPCESAYRLSVLEVFLICIPREYVAEQSI